jgi:hypothetical protein
VVGIFFKADIREESPCRVKAISAVRYLSKVDVCTKINYGVIDKHTMGFYRERRKVKGTVTVPAQNFQKC